MNSDEELLREINKHVPEDIDWKQGAITYLSNLIKTEGGHNERFHLIKPFLGGPDFSDFFLDFYHFLNTLERLNLPMKSSVLDVACGPGWVSHYLAKLGHRVVGFDISKELLEIAETRLASDPYPPYEGIPFSFQFLEHDIESGPLPGDEKFDAAILDAALHHFYNPIAALRNLAPSLKQDGLLAVIEGAAPEEGSPYFEENLRLMKEYQTLERPYSRNQLVRLLRTAGFGHLQFFNPVNGLYRPIHWDADSAREEVLLGRDLHVVIASQTLDGLNRVVPEYQPGESSGDNLNLLFESGFSEREGSFRWSGAESRIWIGRDGRLSLRLFTNFYGSSVRQKIFIRHRGTEQVVQLTRKIRPEANLSLEVAALDRLEFKSDRVFSPVWHGLSDERLLSFGVEASLE